MHKSGYGKNATKGQMMKGHMTPPKAGKGKKSGGKKK